MATFQHRAARSRRCGVSHVHHRGHYLRAKEIKAFCDAVAPDYYVDEDTARWAASTRRAFKLIDNVTITKIDVFCCKDGPLSREQLVRRIFVEAGGLRLPLPSPEDIILQKLLDQREPR